MIQRGNAIECRIYAEDPENNFFPSVGKLLLVKEPHGPGVRCDSGIYSGFEVSHHYDPILAKLIAYAETRTGAIRRMISALESYVILGIKTPIPFLIELLSHPEFEAGNLHTGFIESHFNGWKHAPDEKLLELALIAAAQYEPPQASANSRFSREIPPTPWQSLGEWDMFG